MLLRIDTASPTPIYRQLAGQIRRSIAEGTLTARERLPAARDLAASLEINMHTVRQAYGELAREGLVDMRQGRGVSVRAGARAAATGHDLARQLVAEARRFGMTDNEIRDLVEHQL